MSRCKISVGVLCVLLLLCITGLFTMKFQCDAFFEQISAVSEAVRAEDMEEALLRFDKLEDSWESFHNITGVFVDGSKLDPIKESISGLRPLLEIDHPEALSELEKLKFLTANLFEEEIPEGWHIL